MKIDTGAAVSVITPELARAARLTPVAARAGAFRSLTATSAPPVATAQHVQFGSLAVGGAIPLRVLSFSDSRGVLLGALIGQDLLDGYDYDFDLPHARLVPYRTANCAAIDVPWPDTYTTVALTRGAANGYDPSVVAFATMAGLRLAASVPVELDGYTVDALFDTGAVGSLLSRAGARAAGVTGAQIAADPIFTGIGLDGGTIILRRHVFPNTSESARTSCTTFPSPSIRFSIRGIR